MATASKVKLPAVGVTELGNKIFSTTWGTLLLILSLTAVSVGVYAPIKNNIYGGSAPDLEPAILLILFIGGISTLFLIILASAIPYRKQRQAALVVAFNRLFLELKTLLWLAFFIGCLLFLNLAPDQYPTNLESMILETNIYFYLIGLPVTFLLLFLLYLNLCYLKEIHYAGLREGLLEKSLVGKILLYISASIRRTLDQLLDTEIDREYKGRLLTLVGINFLALLVIASTGLLGILLAVVYTVFLFNYAVKVLEKARELYRASSQLALGNFAISLPEDVGILTPFARNLNNIKEGFKIAVEEEVKSQNMKTQLISNVSHDLKTPLTSIISYVDLLKDEDLDEESRRQYVEILDQKSQRLKTLIDDLFEASKASSGNIELHWEELDIIALLRQTMGEMEEKIKDSTLQIRLKLPEEKVLCRLDGQRTYRVFENILSNILKYSLPQTRVYIDVEEEAGRVSLTFKNISAYEMNFDPEEIVERFTQGDKSRSTEGSGLGLAIAKSLVELQGGRLEINIDGDLFKLTVIFPTLEQAVPTT
ncbi:MAG: sensor histidine kinase [bacterium]|nr:sensor histidine kinase [Bacillota bacterium]HHW54722.1 sensor histidine kinase [Bacillota bacterium]